jgi:general secretion pathway protein A
MYEQFFGFRDRPFDLTSDPRFLVLTEAHREALSNLEYGFASRKGVTLLVGEAGSGKTTVIRAAIERQPMRVHSVHLHNPTLTRAEFSEMLAVRFGLSGRAAQSKTAMLVELEALLRHRQSAGETTVLVIDEAQSLPLDLLEEIRLLANMEVADEKLLSVVIAGQPELAGRLNDDSLRQLKQRIALRCELLPLTLPQTAGYIAGRIRAAGGMAAEVFSREAVHLIFERSQGIPRTVNVIADNALLGGFAAGRKPVTSQIVRDVCRDFDFSRDGETPVNGTHVPKVNGRHHGPLLTVGKPPEPVPAPAPRAKAATAPTPAPAADRASTPAPGPASAVTQPSTPAPVPAPAVTQPSKPAPGPAPAVEHPSKPAPAPAPVAAHTSRPAPAPAAASGRPSAPSPAPESEPAANVPLVGAPLAAAARNGNTPGPDAAPAEKAGPEARAELFAGFKPRRRRFLLFRS